LDQLSSGAADINADGDSNEYIDVGPITIGTGDVSLSAWVNVSTFVNLGGIISNRQTASTYPGLEIRTRDSSKIEIAIDDGGSNTESISGALNTNQWYHVCAVFDRSDKQFLYIDGVLVDSDDITSENLTLNHSDSVLIGRRDTTGYDFQGYICNVGYWNAALTQPQVKSIMNKDYASLSASEKEDLVSWWNLDSIIANTTQGVSYVYDNHFGGGSELGSELSPNVNFSSNITGWSDYNSGTVSYDSDNQALKATNDGTNTWLGMTTDAVVGEANSKYLVTGRVYIPTGWSGGDIEFNEGGSFGGGGDEAFARAIEENLDQWQDASMVFDTAADTSGKIYIRCESNPDSGDYVLIDNISIKKINGNPGKLQ